MEFRNSRLCAILLNLIVPGFGHIYWREYVFGLFVFLITLIAGVLFFVSFFLSLSFWVKFLMLTLPVLFYIFTFADLLAVVKAKQNTVRRGRRAALLFFLIGSAYQLASPVAPIGFGLHNAPEVFTMPDNSLSPMYSKGNLLKASRLSYMLNAVFISRPILHKIPVRYDIIRFTDNASGKRLCGIVIGMPDENIQISDGLVVIDGEPDFNVTYRGLTLMGDWPLTYVEGYSILVATLSLGTVDAVYQVPLQNVIGKISKVF